MVIAQKTRIVFMVKVRYAGCTVRRDRIVANIALGQRVEGPPWSSVEEVVPGWFVHRLDARTPADLEHPSLPALICESRHLFGERGRLAPRDERRRLAPRA